MKKVISVVLIIVVATLLVFSLCACNSENKICGEWKFFGVDENYFSGNDRYTATNMTYSGTLIFQKDGTITDKYADVYLWVYEKETKTYFIAEEKNDFSLDNCFDKAQIDKDGFLHIASYIYKKA